MKIIAGKRTLLFVLIAAALLMALTLSSGTDLTKIDYRKVHSRAGWQLPDRVIESLAIRPGDHLADIGAGDGYFTFSLADAVGPSGRVYAVDVSEKAVSTLQKKVDSRGYSNVVVVLAEYDDPLLPDDEIDLTFLCNTYHHIEERTEYFRRLRNDLTPRGRVAIVDMKGGLLMKLIGHDEHWTALETLLAEMQAAGYRKLQELEFLPMQHFVIFRPS